MYCDLQTDDNYVTIQKRFGFMPSRPRQFSHTDRTKPNYSKFEKPLPYIRNYNKMNVKKRCMEATPSLQKYPTPVLARTSISRNPMFYDRRYWLKYPDSITNNKTYPYGRDNRAPVGSMVNTKKYATQKLGKF